MAAERLRHASTLLALELEQTRSNNTSTVDGPRATSQAAGVVSQRPSIHLADQSVAESCWDMEEEEERTTVAEKMADKGDEHVQPTQEVPVEEHSGSGTITDGPQKNAAGSSLSIISLTSEEYAGDTTTVEQGSANLEEDKAVVGVEVPDEATQGRLPSPSKALMAELRFVAHVTYVAVYVSVSASASVSVSFCLRSCCCFCLCFSSYPRLWSCVGFGFYLTLKGADRHLYYAGRNVSACMQGFEMHATDTHLRYVQPSQVFERRLL